MSPEELQEPEKKDRSLLYLAILLALIALPPVVLFVGSQLSQGFYDDFAFKYYWGPIANDAGATTDSESAYNKVNTITYGLMAVLGSIATYIIFRDRFRRTNTKPDLWFFLAVIPLIIAGSVYRTLEDAMIFERPFRYFFITPIIYGVLWAIAVLLAIYTFQTLMVYRGRRKGACKVQDNPVLRLVGKVPGILYLVLPLVVMDLFYAWVYWFRTDWYLILPPPALVFLISFMFMGALYFLQRGQGRRLEFFTVFTFYSVFILLIGLALIIQWPNNSQWMEFYESKDYWYGTNLNEYYWVFSIAILCTIVIGFPAFLLRSRWPKLGAYCTGPNILIIFSHFLDASATYRALDFYGEQYVEKHVLPNFFIDLAGTALVMFPLKALLVIVFIFIVDIYYTKYLPEEESERFDYLVFFGLIKVIVIMVGLAPGLRDVFRLGMGV